MPQPIDFQTELTRTTAVERIQQAADRMAMLNQQRLAHEIEAQEALAETQVPETHPKSGDVEPELKRKNPFIGRKHRENQDQDADAEDEAPEKHLPQPPPEPHSLDVTI